MTLFARCNFAGVALLSLFQKWKVLSTTDFVLLGAPPCTRSPSSSPRPHPRFLFIDSLPCTEGQTPWMYQDSSDTSARLPHIERHGDEIRLSDITYFHGSRFWLLGCSAS